MNACYVSEGRVEELHVPACITLPGKHKIHRGVFKFSGTNEFHDCIRVYKGDVLLAVVFYSDDSETLSVLSCRQSTSFSFKTVCLFANIMDQWDSLMSGIPMDHEVVADDDSRQGKLEIQMKVITLSKAFPSYHPRAGEPTGFADAFLSGRKIHTIRENEKGYYNPGDIVSVRQWSGVP